MMMKLQCNPKKLDPQYAVNGKKIFNLMQDRETDSCDLLVREAVQNSSDAITQYGNPKGKIFFDIGDFETKPLIDCLDDEKYHFGSKFKTKKKIGDKACFLSIRDFETYGLCGTFHKTDYKRNNLFSLVYSILEDNKGDDKGVGGSHGIGKTVYYRFGKQLVFYYSKAREESGEIVSKLAGVYLEDCESQKPDTIFDSNYSGIVCFGKNETYNEFNLSGPIYDENDISAFLSIFGLKPFKDDKTGTVIIIPFVEPSHFDFSDENDFKLVLENKLWLLCQRWYFPRINNENFKGSFLEIYINNQKKELIPFFQKMQDLYNGFADGEKISLEPKKNYGIFGNYGYFYYKVFTAEELEVLVPPNNYASPFDLLDLDSSEKGPIFFYTRSPGMVINYKYNDELKINPSNLEENEYLIGCYVVNKECRDSTNRTLDEYFKKSERDNHKAWQDLTNEKFSDCKPFDDIKKQIKKHLKGEFESTHLVDPQETTNTKLQKKLGSLLVAPSGFGLGKKTPLKAKRKPSKNTTKYYIDFSGFKTGKSLPAYEILINFEPKEICTLHFMIKTETKSFTVPEWMVNGFEVPFEADSIEVKEYGLNGGNIYHPHKEYEFDSEIICLKDPAYGECAKIDLIKSQSNSSALLISNLTDKGFTLTFELRIKPLSQDYQFKINNEFMEA